MPVAVQIRMQRSLHSVLKGKLEPYTFDVGVLNDRAHKTALPASRGFKTVAGGLARKTNPNQTDGTVSSVSAAARRRLGINYLTAPFKRRSQDAVRLFQGFFKLAFADSKASHKRRVENLLQAIVRNPIVRGDYGNNSKKTSRIKGFNRKFVDTAQLFRAITARVKINSVRR